MIHLLLPLEIVKQGVMLFQFFGEDTSLKNLVLFSLRCQPILRECNYFHFTSALLSVEYYFEPLLRTRASAANAPQDNSSIPVSCSTTLELISEFVCSLSGLKYLLMGIPLFGQ